MTSCGSGFGASFAAAGFALRHCGVVGVSQALSPAPQRPEVGHPIRRSASSRCERLMSIWGQRPISHSCLLWNKLLFLSLVTASHSVACSSPQDIAPLVGNWTQVGPSNDVTLGAE